MQHWRTVMLIGLMVSVSGCITAVNDDNATTSTEAEPEPTPVRRSASEGHSCNVGAPALPIGDRPVCDRYEVQIDAAVFEIEFELEWDNAGNSYSLQVETPSGDRLSEDQSDNQEIELLVTDTETGTYGFWPRAESVAFQDELELTVTYHWMDDGTAKIEIPTPTIEVEQQGDRWRATMRYVAVGTTADTAQLDVHTINGDVSLSSTTDDDSRADMEVFAWANSEARARELVKAIQIGIGITSDQIRAEVEEQPRQLDDNEGVGAHIDIETPATVGGSAGTTNGDVVFEGLALDDLSVSSTNGEFEGTVDAYGDLTGSTTNGGFDLDITPHESLNLDFSTTNGGADIGLKEASDIGYHIDASTTNGEVTESMDEASLDGEENRATLQTEGYSGRDIQVSGSITSTNGSIHFLGL